MYLFYPNKKDKNKILTNKVKTIMANNALALRMKYRKFTAEQLNEIIENENFIPAILNQIRSQKGVEKICLKRY